MSTNHRKTNINWHVVFTGLSFCLSVIAILLVEFPQLKPWNSDLISMAKSGDVKAQMKLANYYFLVGDNDKSIYWYQILSERTSDYQAVAINNIAYLYLVDEERYKNLKPDFYNHILSLFIKAYKMGSEDSRKNIYEMIQNIPIVFIEKHYSDAKDICEGYNMIDEEQINSSEWVYDHQEELTIKSDKWQSGGYENRIEIIDGEKYLYISELKSCRSYGIGDVILSFQVSIYKQTNDKHMIYTYILPEVYD